MLTIAFNGTTANGSDTLVAAQLEELIRITGTSAAPVVGVTLAGLTFAHTLTDYMLPYTVPSGGDWSFHDGGMVRLSGTTNTQVLNCVFWAPGGNGLMISGFNRATNVSNNHFAWTGASAIVSAGLGGGNISANSPEYPEGTLIQGNLAREIGVYVKQSGFYYQGISANVTLKGNVAFNAARAAVNINDGFAGGHFLSQNLFFNTVRETNDHGAINSWDRQPYAWRSWNTTNVDPLPMLITRNFIINNYHGVWGLCHDDGSNGYVDTYNFLPWSGSKNYLGFYKQTYNNYFLYSDFAPARLADLAAGKEPTQGWNACAMSYGTKKIPSSLADVWASNTCITSSGGAFFSFNGCDSATPNDGGIPLLSNNTYASDDGKYELHCGSQTWTLAQAQAAGVDVGSTMAAVPTTAEVIAVAHDLLQF